MTVQRAQILIDSYDSNSWLIHRLCDGISDDESVLQPPFPANCMNWILGHMLGSRHIALGYLETDSFWSVASFERYRTGSPPVTDGRDAVPFATLMGYVDSSAELLKTRLAKCKAAYLGETIDTRFGPQGRSKAIDGLHWHETFHLGQLDLLKAMIADDKGAPAQ